MDLVRTGLQRVVDKTLDRLPSDQVLVKDLVGIFDLHVTVPDVFRVHDDHRPVAALIHAPGVVDSNRLFQAGLLHQLLQACVNRSGVAVHGWTPVSAGANENVFLKRTHD